MGELAITPNDAGQAEERAINGTALESDISVLLLRNQQLLHANPQWAFPQGAAGQLFNTSLEHVPFLIVGDVQWRRKPASTIPVRDESGAITGTRTIPEQDCVQLRIRQIERSTNTVMEPRLATLTGAYLLNQVKSLEESGPRSMLYGGYVWTLRRNPEHVTAGGQHPWMLGLWDQNLDDVPF